MSFKVTGIKLDHSNFNIDRPESEKDSWGHSYRKRSMSLPITKNDYLKTLVSQWGLNQEQEIDLKECGVCDTRSFFEWCRDNFLP